MTAAVQLQGSLDESCETVELPAAPPREVELERRPWQPVDLTSVLNGTHVQPEPAVGARTDGVPMFYPGRVHSVASEPEGGKTWLVLVAAAHELRRGNAVVYIDFEDDEAGVAGRLLLLGVTPELITDAFAYIRPDEPIGRGLNAPDLRHTVETMKPTLVVIDGVTEAMNLHGLKIGDNNDLAHFSRLLPRRLAVLGPAVVLLDHVVKSSEERGRWAIGGQHKLAALDGAAYTLDNRQPFGIGRVGRSTIRIAKDRPGALRRHALPSAAGLYWFGDLVLDSTGNGAIKACVYPPQDRAETGGLRPTHVMAKVSATLAKHPAGLSKNAIETMTGGKAATVRTALELLVTEGYVVTKAGARGALLHVSVRPFVEGSEVVADEAE